METTIDTTIGTTATKKFDLALAGRESISETFNVDLLRVEDYQPLQEVNGQWLPKTGLDPMSRITVRYPGREKPIDHLVFNRAFPNGKIPFIGSQALPVVLSAYQSSKPDKNGNPYLRISSVRFDVENLHEKAISLLKD